MIINKKDLQPGDLIFYSYEDNGQFRNISHVAIYVGDGKMVLVTNSKRDVVLDPLRTSSVVFYARPYRKKAIGVILRLISQYCIPGNGKSHAT